MGRDWQVFKRKATATATGPMVTLQKQGNISINYAAFEALGEPTMVEFLYDPRERLMGLRSVSDRSPHAYPLRKQSSGSGFIVSGRAFTQHHNIETDHAKRYRAQIDDGVLAVDLKDWEGSRSVGGVVKWGEPWDDREQRSRRGRGKS